MCSMQRHVERQSRSSEGLSRRHESARNQVEQASVTLHGLRLNAATEVILDVESYVNLLANSPKEFDTSVAEFRVEANRFQGTVSRLETQAARTTRLGAGTGAAGVSAGVGVAASRAFGGDGSRDHIWDRLNWDGHFRTFRVQPPPTRPLRGWAGGAIAAGGGGMAKGDRAAGLGRACRIGTGWSGLGRVRGVSQQPQ